MLKHYHDNNFFLFKTFQLFDNISFFLGNLNMHVCVNNCVNCVNNRHIGNLELETVHDCKFENFV